MAYDSGSDRVVLSGGWDGVSYGDTWAYDFNTNTWTNMDPAVKPPGREGQSMAYDSGSDRVILFGGEGAVESILSDTWAYDLDTNMWTNMDPAVTPPGRYYHAMAYDSGSDRVILFGGEGAVESILSDTWAYDLDTNMWTNMDPAVTPPARIAHAMAYDAQSDRVILFGGVDDVVGEGVNDAVILNDTWAYDLNSNTWTNMDAVVNPGLQYYHAMAYDSGSDRVIQFGFAIGSTWAYDFEANMWTSLNPSARPPARISHAMAYDSESDRVILFGGVGAGGTLFDPPWAYDFEANMWVELSISNFMVYDSESDRIILVTRNGDTWAYDYDSDMWIKRSAVGGPSGNTIGIAYDSESDRVIISRSVGGGINWAFETWAYDFNTNSWVSTNPGTRPSARYFHAMAYDSESDRVILFGEYDGTPGLNDTWAYDFNTNTWTNMTRPGGPPSLFGSSMTYDSQSDRIVLFGGVRHTVDFATSQCMGYTWSYDYNTNAWTNMTRPSGPMGRALSAVAYDSDHDRIILYGGGCTEGQRRGHHDTWAYDFDTNTWTNLTPSSDPGPRWGHAMAYDSQSHVIVLFGGQSRSPSPVNLGPWWYRYPESAPASPRSLRAIEGNRQVTLTWEPPDFDGSRPITGYRVYRFTWPEGLSIVATVGLVLTYTDTGLTNGVLYYYWVSALNAIGDGTLSETAAATPRLTLSAPVNLQAAAGNGRVVLTWQPASSGDGSPVTGYRIYRGTSLDSLTTAAWVGNVLKYLDTDVTNGVTYYYRASALIGPDEGPRSREAMARPTESTKPIVAILSPADGTTLTSTSVIISGSAFDDTAIQRVELSRDGTNWVTVTGTTSWSGSVNLGEGTNRIYARATDTSGNTGTMSISVTVSNPVLASLSSPIVIAAVAAGIAAVVGAVLIRRWRDRRWERK